MALRPDTPGAYTRLHANGSALCRTGAGTLQRVVISTKGASSNTLTLYDGIDNTGAVIGVLDTTTTVGAIPYNCRVAVGVYATLATGTAADLVVVTS